MNANDRTKHLYAQTDKLGLEHPTVDMIFEAIRDAEFNALMNPEEVAREHDLLWKHGRVVEPTNRRRAKPKQSNCPNWNGGCDSELGDACPRGASCPAMQFLPVEITNAGE